jgi:pilus assembly protein Flp/PilA
MSGDPGNHVPQLFGSPPQRKVPPTSGEAPLGVNQGGRMLRLRAIIRCEKGANAIEYALVASLIAIAAVGAMHNLGNKIDGMLNNVQNAL